MECITFRQKAHVGPWEDVSVGFRKKELVDKWKKRCPLKMFERLLIKASFLSKTEMKNIYRKIDKQIQEALLFALKSSFPKASELQRNVFS